jgi:hypothetical protein
MRIRKDKMVAAIDQIVADAEKRTAAYDKAAIEWEKERLQRWLDEEKPKWRELQQLIFSKTRGKQVVTFGADVGDYVAHVENVGIISTAEGGLEGAAQTICADLYNGVPGLSEAATNLRPVGQRQRR